MQKGINVNRKQHFDKADNFARNSEKQWKVCTIVESSIHKIFHQTCGWNFHRIENFPPQ